jgi:predicted GTPase
MKGRFWNFRENRPEPQLTDFLKQKADSIQRRIKETNKLDIEPVYYSAGYTDGKESQKPYNISRLFYLIVKNLKSQKAIMVALKKSRDRSNFERDDNNDGGAGYRRKTESSLLDKARDVVGYVYEKACDAFESVSTTVSNVCSSIGSFFSSFW